MGCETLQDQNFENDEDVKNYLEELFLELHELMRTQGFFGNYSIDQAFSYWNTTPDPEEFSWHASLPIDRNRPCKAVLIFDSVETDHTGFHIGSNCSYLFGENVLLWYASNQNDNRSRSEIQYYCYCKSDTECENLSFQVDQEPKVSAQKIAEFLFPICRREANKEILSGMMEFFEWLELDVQSMELLRQEERRIDLSYDDRNLRQFCSGICNGPAWQGFYSSLKDRPDDPSDPWAPLEPWNCRDGVDLFLRHEGIEHRTNSLTFEEWKNLWTLLFDEIVFEDNAPWDENWENLVCEELQDPDVSSESDEEDQGSWSDEEQQGSGSDEEDQ